ncbi:MAG: hypothetical protein IJC09_04465 [Clostridia bacterium]|nr:hypothetical protein [Clostridia bacterium]
MARKARVKSSTGKYIILLRGMEDSIFRTKKIKDIFNETIESYLGKNMLGIRFFTDRVVIFAKESKSGIAMDLKPVLIKFARAYNRERGVDGKVFMDRFKSLPVEDKEFEAQCKDFVDGGKVKDPFEVKAVIPVAPKKETVKPAPKKVEKPVAKKPEPKPEPEVKPAPKKRNDMPTWLL